MPARTGVLLRCAEPTSPTPGLPARVDYTTWGRTSLPQWPEREDGRWVLRALDLGHDGDADGATGARPNSATAPVATVPARTRIRDLHDSTRGSNRAPLVLTTRSTRWSDELFVSALREELLGVCPAEETVCKPAGRGPPARSPRWARSRAPGVGELGPLRLRSPDLGLPGSTVRCPRGAGRLGSSGRGCRVRRLLRAGRSRPLDGVRAGARRPPPHRPPAHSAGPGARGCPYGFSANG
ncbi:hypothetical protein C1701_16635 [Actinoalloteichus sp. AHMU CJ021]|nr:hypothetical protein C1701_16635 [Actinoalloteichus sp. AHMU CJ021]